MDKIEFDNNWAIQELLSGNFLEAQLIFRRNKKRYVDYRTYNNYGMFLYEHGMTDKNEHVRSAISLGIRCLLQSLAFNPSVVVINNLGRIYFEQGDMELSLHFYQKAALFGDKESVYNMAVVKYFQHDYESTISLAETILDSIKESKILYVFALTQIDKSKARKIVNNNPIWLDELDKMELMSFYHECELYDNIVEMGVELFEEWHLSVEQWAIFINACVQCGNTQLLNKVIQLYGGNYRTSIVKKIKQLRQYPEDCQTIYYHYSPAIITRCGYFGCPTHNTKW